MCCPWKRDRTAQAQSSASPLIAERTSKLRKKLHKLPKLQKLQMHLSRKQRQWEMLMSQIEVIKLIGVIKSCLRRVAEAAKSARIYSEIKSYKLATFFVARFHSLYGEPRGGYKSPIDNWRGFAPSIYWRDQNISIDFFIS